MKLTFPLLNTTINVPADEPAVNARKTRRSYVRSKRIDEKSGETNEVLEKTEGIPGGDIKSEQKLDSTTEAEAQPQIAPEGSTQPLLMVEVVNVTHEKFRQTEEIKVNFNFCKIIFSMFSNC